MSVARQWKTESQVEGFLDEAIDELQRALTEITVIADKNKPKGLTKTTANEFQTSTSSARSPAVFFHDAT